MNLLKRPCVGFVWELLDIKRLENEHFGKFILFREMLPDATAKIIVSVICACFFACINAT